MVCTVFKSKTDSSAETRSLIHFRGQFLRLRSDGKLVVSDRWVAHQPYSLSLLAVNPLFQDSHSTIPCHLSVAPLRLLGLARGNDPLLASRATRLATIMGLASCPCIPQILSPYLWVSSYRHWRHCVAHCRWGSHDMVRQVLTAPCATRQHAAIAVAAACADDADSTLRVAESPGVVPSALTYCRVRETLQLARQKLYTDRQRQMSLIRKDV